jgi:hypothetical protein
LVKQKEPPVLAWSQETTLQHPITHIRSRSIEKRCPFGVPPFGKFLLTSAAILYLHTDGSLFGRLVLFEEALQFQQIIDPKCRSTCGDAIEGVPLNNVCHVGHEGFKPAAGVVIKDPVLAPGELPRHQLVLGAAEGMKRMDDPKSTYADAGTTCI